MSHSEEGDNIRALMCGEFLKTTKQIFETQPTIYEVRHKLLEDNYVVINVYNIHNEKLCVEMYYKSDTNEIIINDINKCGNPGEIDGSGTNILDKLSLIFQIFQDRLTQELHLSLKLKMKIDIDASRINHLNISISWLYLFTTGETWYNSKGFIENNYKENTKLMNKFISFELITLLQQIDSHTMSEIITQLTSEGLSPELTIKELFGLIHEKIKHITENNDQAQFYNKLIAQIKDMFYTFLKKKYGMDNPFINFPQQKMFSQKFKDIEYRPEYRRKLLDELRSEQLGGQRRYKRTKKSKKSKKSKRSKRSKGSKRRS
jgi:hypothetical protein